MSNENTIPVQNDEDFIVKGGGGGVFINPQNGTFQAVIVDVVNLGIVKSANPKFKDSEKVRLVYQLDERITTEMLKEAYAAEGKVPTEDQLKLAGKRFTAREDFTKSFSKDSNLRKRVVPVIGRKLTDQEEANGFNLLNLLGLNVQLTIDNVTLKSDSSRTFPKITNVIAWPSKYGPAITVEDYIRVKDRKEDAKKEDAPWRN